MQRSAFWSYLVLGGGVLSLGFSPIFIRWADAPGTVTSMYRMAFAALALAVPFLRTLRRTGAFPRHALWMTICGGFFFAMDIGFWSTGVVLGGATNPTLLDTIAPLWVGLFFMLFFKQHLGKRFWIGLAIALAGAVVILGFDLQTDLRQAQGALLGLVGGIFYGGYVMFIERGREGLGALACFWISTASAAFFLLLFNIAAGHALSGYDSNTMLAFLGAGLLNQIGGFLSVHLRAGLSAFDNCLSSAPDSTSCGCFSGWPPSERTHPPLAGSRRRGGSVWALLDPAQPVSHCTPAVFGRLATILLLERIGDSPIYFPHRIIPQLFNSRPGQLAVHQCGRFPAHKLTVKSVHGNMEMGVRMLVGADLRPHHGCYA